jgi:hypothetical protein
MSFGLTNAPTYFLYLMNKIFMEYVDKLGDFVYLTVSPMSGLHCFKI